MTIFKRLDIVVLAGGISHERDVSLRSGRRVAEELQAAGHSVTLRDPDASLFSALTEKAPDVVWPALHGASGEDGALQALLRARGIRYVGSHPEGAGLAWFKPTAKVLVSRAGIATPDWLTLPNGTFRELGANGVLAEVLHGIGATAVVKPAQGGSAQGVTIVTDAADLPRAMVDAYTYSDVALIEKKIEGTELAITVMDSGHGPVAQSEQCVYLHGYLGSALSDLIREPCGRVERRLSCVVARLEAVHARQWLDLDCRKRHGAVPGVHHRYRQFGAFDLLLDQRDI
jgi:D-alanine-D-alanine ligase